MRTNDLLRELPSVDELLRDEEVRFLRASTSHRQVVQWTRAAIDLCDELQSTEPSSPLYIGRENLARRIPRSERVFPE